MQAAMLRSVVGRNMQHQCKAVCRGPYALGHLDQNIRRAVQPRIRRVLTAAEATGDMTGSAIKLVYFPIRGLAEQIRMALVQADIPYEEEAVDREEMKSDLSKFCFGQCPRIMDGDLNITQSNAIMRYIGNKGGLYGTSDGDKARIDMVLDGITAIRQQYLHLIYFLQLAEEAKKEHWSKHGDPATFGGRNGGAHWTYLSAILQSNSTGFVVGSQLSIADIALADLTFNYLRSFGDQMKANYPEIVQHNAMVFSQERIAAYISSGKQFDKVNNNGLG